MAVDPALWDDPQMRSAIARRDIPTVFRLLVESGVSQRQIAQLTSQKQSSVSGIVHGRQVVSVPLLERIAAGLGIPLGWMGLAYDASSSASFATPEELSDDVKRRRLIASAAALVVGRPVLGEVLRLDVAVSDTPLPTRIGRGEVAALRALTEQFRVQGRAGYGVPDVLSEVASRAERMLTVPTVDSEAVRRALLSQLAELHTLAGWWRHDALQTGRAWDHYGRAMQLAGQAGDVPGMVSAARHAAIIDRDGGAPNDALKLYQLATVKLSGMPRTSEVAADLGALHVRAAQAWALLERPDDARRELARAADLPPQSDPFERADTGYARADVELALGRPDVAEQYARAALRTWSDGDRRDSAGARITLAVAHARAGEPDAPALAAGALDAVAGLPSKRTRALLIPLEKALAARKGSGYAEAAQRVREVRVGVGLDRV